MTEIKKKVQGSVAKEFGTERNDSNGNSEDSGKLAFFLRDTGWKGDVEE